MNTEEKMQLLQGMFNGAQLTNVQVIGVVENGAKVVYQEQQEKKGKERGEAELPEALATEEAKRLWDAAQNVGWVDECWQPKLSRALSAVLADRMATLLDIKDKWKAFEGLWMRNNMRSDYNYALNQKQYGEFYEKMLRIIR